MTNSYAGLTVLDNMVLVEIMPEERVTKSGIIIASNETSRMETGKETGIVRAVGEYAFTEMGKMVPEISNKVLFKRYSGVEVNKKEEGRPWFRVMNDRDILLILSDEEV